MLGFIGTVSSYAKSRQLETKWEMKKQSGNFIAGIDLMNAENIRQANKAEKAKKLSSITEKLKAGKRLTTAEMQFLRANNAELYKKAVMIEAEREAYKKELKSCKTKEDVDRLHTKKLGQLAGDARAVSGGSMPQEKKQSALEFIQMNIAAIQDEQDAFVKSGAYKNLPDSQKEMEEKRHGKVSKIDEAIAKTAYGRQTQIGVLPKKEKYKGRG